MAEESSAAAKNSAESAHNSDEIAKQMKVLLPVIGFSRIESSAFEIIDVERRNTRSSLSIEADDERFGWQR